MQLISEAQSTYDASAPRRPSPSKLDLLDFLLEAADFASSDLLDARRIASALDASRRCLSRRFGPASSRRTLCPAILCSYFCRVGEGFEASADGRMRALLS